MTHCDLISREALLKEFKRYISAEENARNYRTADVWRWALLDVQDAPAVDAAQDVNVIDDIVNDNVNGNVKGNVRAIASWMDRASDIAIWSFDGADVGGETGSLTMCQSCRRRADRDEIQGIYGRTGY